MACFHPLTAGRPAPGYPLSFGSAIKANFELLKVRCGQCIGCRLDHSLMWATRATHESRSHQDTCFITLTYADETMPHSLSVHAKPLQQFFRALRYHIKTENPDNPKIKYLACGEYSPKKRRPVGPFNPWEFVGEGERPHYHAVVFGYDFPDKELWTVRNDNRIFTSDILTDIWGKGHCTTAAVTFESAAYVARYSIKKLNGTLAQRPDPVTGLLPYERICHTTGQILEVEKERFHTSNGIGKDHYLSYTGDIYPNDSVVINGHETRPPRYYDNLFKAEDPHTMETIQDRRIQQMRKHAADNTPDRLAEREKVKQAQLNQLKRELS